VFAVFSLGIATGGFGTYVYDRHTDLDAADRNDATSRKLTAKQQKERFYDYLGATAEQRVQLDKIYENGREQLGKLADQTRPQSRMIWDQTRERIHAVLNEEQKQRYEEWRTKQQQRRPPSASLSPGSSKH
jgi:hypothetical protein